MPTMDFFHDDCFKGIGISEGLARGLQVMAAGVNLTQEGMGLGAIAIRSNGYTYFSQGSRVVWPDSNNMIQDYVIDTIHMSGRGESANIPVTWISEFFVVLYRLLPACQKGMLWAGIHTRRWLGIKSHFIAVSPRAQARFHLKIHTNRIEVCCNFKTLAKIPHELYIMNELGGSFFTSSWQAGEITKTPPGWQVLDDSQSLPFLYSPIYGLRYSLRDITVDQDLP